MGQHRRPAGKGRTRLIWLVLATLFGTGMIVVVPSANADSPITTRIDADWVRRTVLELPPTTLTAGEPRYLYGHYGAHTSTGLLQGVQIRCTSEGNTYESVNTTMDHPGDGSVRVVAVRWLFTPPVTGEYRCAMNGFATHINPEGKYLTVVGGDRTRLTMSAPAPGGVEWRIPAGHNPRVDYDRPETSTREDIAKVLNHRFEARPDATGIAVRTGVEVSRVSTGGNSPFVARTTLRVTQLDANGAACTSAVTTSKTTTFDVHHIKVHLDLDVPIRTTGGCTRMFAVETVVQYLPHPNHPQVVRHGGMVEDGVYSNTLVLNT
ncbi:MAG TPA: hypothetical protein VIL37_18385 [Natronosporangium sp.]